VSFVATWVRATIAHPRWAWLRLLVLLNLATACGDGSSQTEDGLSAPAWAVLGSSSAAGVGASSGHGWVALLKRPSGLLGSPIHNLARSGAVTFNALPVNSARPADRPATEPSMDIDTVLASAPGLLILAFPSNDTMAGYTAAETTANLLGLRSRALASRVAVVPVSSHPRNDASAAQKASMVEFDAALAGQAGPCFVDLRGTLSLPTARSPAS